MTTKEQSFLLLFSLLIVFTLPSVEHINAKAIILFALYNIWLWWKYKSYTKKYLAYCIVALLFSFVFLLGISNTTNLNAALKLAETRLSLVVLPLLLLIAGRLWSKDLIRTVLVAFAVTTIICGLIIQGWLVADLLSHGKSLADFFYWRVSGADLSYRIGIHPSYLSMYVLFSIGIIYEFFIVEEHKALKIIPGCFSIVYLVILTLHLSSRISLIVLALVLLLFFFHAVSHFSRKAWIGILPLAILLYWLFSLDNFSIKSRLENNIGLDWSFFLDNKRPNDSIPHDNRTYEWYSAVELIKENLWFGVGSGDVDDSLHEHYRELKAYSLIEAQANAHNQFFDAIIRNGILGFISLLGLYFYGVYRTRIKRLYLIFTFVIVITSLTENILDRQKGVVFFAVFNTLLFKYYKVE